MPPELRVIGLPGLPEIAPGDDLGGLIVEAVRRAGVTVRARDVFVVTQKVVSKAEGRLVRLADVTPSARAREWAAANGKDPRIIDVALRESIRIVRMDLGVLIVETAHGFVCANAGVDGSNVPAGMVALLPEDPDRSAGALADRLTRAFGQLVAVIVSDTFGRPWREGQVNVAIGVAGMRPLTDYRGQPDTQGRALQATVVATADELAAAAELVMAKTADIPVAIVSGAAYAAGEGAARDLIRPAAQDLFR